MPENQVEEIKLRTDIVSIIGERIELKKAGRNYKANCPFHGEKTPSFMVSPELQIFKCFGCAEAGDVFTFLEKYEGMEFPEALKYLADRAGIKLKRSNFGETTEREKLIDIHSQALKFYNYLLLTHPLGARALEYLEKDRGLKRATIEEFQLGYAPDDSLLIKKFLVDKKKIDPRDLERGGIAIARGQSIYDRFSGRIIFPLFDHRGNPIGFAGRILPWDKRETGKYINSPETPIYHKSSVLFGLNLTRSFVKKKKVAIIVEGELDAISSWQAGIKNVVAIKGSALTEDQVRLLSRFAPKFILALDSDLAGDAAARRGITIAASLGVEVKVAKLTNFKDPDEAARGDLETYKKDLINAEGVWDFLIDSVFARYEGGTGAQKAKISKELIPIISEINDKIVQAHYANLVARKLEVPLDAVTSEISKVGVKQETTESASASVEKKKDRRDLLEERFLALAFQSDPAVLLSKDAEFLVSSPIGKRLLEEYKTFSKNNNKFTVTDFGASLPKELFEGFAAMVIKDGENLSDEPELIKKELDLVKKELKILTAKDKLKTIAIEMRNLEEKGEKDKLRSVQNEFNKLTKILSGYTEADGGGIILNEK
jgi:DNA primase